MAAVMANVLVDWDPDTKSWSIDRSCATQWANLKRTLADKAKDKPYQVKLSVSKVQYPRTLRQNALMWSLLTILAEHDNAGRTGGTQPEDIYIEMLELYGSNFDMLEVPVKAVPLLHTCYRVVKIIEVLDNDRCTVKCGMGSSTFTTAQMANLIDGIFDRIALAGIEDPQVTEYWQTWTNDRVKKVR